MKSIFQVLVKSLDIYPIRRILEQKQWHLVQKLVPANCDAYLRRKFGDYMRLPDLNTIHQHSASITFDA